MAEKLTFDFDNMTVGEVTLLEVEINRQMRDAEMLPPGTIVTFQDILAGFRFSRGSSDDEPRVFVPFGFTMQAVALIQLRRSDPNATWEDAGKVEMDVSAPKAGAHEMIAAAAAAVREPENPRAVMDEALGLTPPTIVPEGPTPAPGPPAPPTP